jgi:hypothetical protein
MLRMIYSVVPLPSGRRFWLFEKRPCRMLAKSQDLENGKWDAYSDETDREIGYGD